MKIKEPCFFTAAIALWLLPKLISFSDSYANYTDEATQK